MSEHARIAALILQRLQSPEATFRTELAELLVDELFAQRVRDAFDYAQLRTVITESLRTDNVRRVIDTHVAPGFARYAAAIAREDVTVQALVDATAHQKLHGIARKLQLPRARWADHALDRVLVRRLLQPVWTQVLLTFAKRLPVPLGNHGQGPAAGSGKSSLTGFLARSVQEQAEKLIDRGRSVMGGLGVEVERRLSAAARDFSDSAAHAFRQTLLERLSSEEGRELVGQILSGFTDHVLRTRFADLQQDLDALPLAEIFDVVPDLVGFATQQPYVQDIVTRELLAWLSVQGDRPLAELLDEYGMRAPLRALLVAHIDRLGASVFATPKFAAWISRLVQPDGTE
jgi:hypothetical protein